MRGLLNPLLVRPSAQPLVRPVRAPSALIRLSARPPVHLHSPCRLPIRPSAPRPPIRLSFAPRLPVRSSASRPPVPPPQSARSALICPCPPVRPLSAPSASSKNYLLFSSDPKFFTSCTPQDIATSAIRGANRSHNGIRVSKFPPLRGQP